MRKYKNSGMSSLSLLALLLVTVFVGLCAFKVTPLYYENMMLKSTLEGIDTPVGTINTLSNTEIRTALQKTFSINGIDLDPRDVIITRNNNITTLSYDYEARTDLIYNISVIAHFETQYPTP